MEIKLTSNCKLTSKVQIMWFATHIYCERISPIYLNSTPIAEHVNFTLCKFQLYNTVLSTIVTKIYINPSKYSFLNCILYYWVPRKKQCSVLELKYTHTHTHTHTHIYINTFFPIRKMPFKAHDLNHYCIRSISVIYTSWDYSRCNGLEDKWTVSNIHKNGQRHNLNYIVK